MYVTAGTTSARVHVIGRWAFAGSVLVGAGMGFAGYRPWACLTVFWLLAWAVWMFSAMMRGQRDIPGNLVHVALLGVALLFACHLARYMVDRSQQPTTTMDGELDASMLFHAALLSLGVFLAQSYLGDGDHKRLTRLCGGAIVLGSAGAIFVPLAPGARDAHVITLLAGLFIFAAPRWTKRPRGLFWSSTARASLLLLAAVCMLVMLGLTILWWNVSGTPVWRTPQGLIGWGESAFSAVSGASSGSSVLAVTTGWLGWGVFVVGLTVALGRAFVRGRWNRTEFFWIIAAAMSTLAILAPGGYFLPLVAVTFALSWGLLPRVCGLPTLRISGLFMVGTMLVIATLLGVTRKVGLLVTISHVFDLNDKQTHGIFGFLLAVVAAWWLGARRDWLGAIGLVAAALIGGLGELAQRIVGLGRAPELADWRAHAFGAALAAALTALCFVTRRGAPVEPSRYATRREKFLGRWAGRGLMVVVLAAAGGWLGLSVWRTVEQWSRKRPWFVISDDVRATGGKNYNFYGVIQPAPPDGTSFLMTVSAEGVRGVFIWHGRLFAGLLGQKTAGLHQQSILGQPFGELSTQRAQEGRFLLIEKGTNIFAVDVAIVMAGRGEETAGLDAALAALKQEGAVILFDTGQPFDYWRIRPIVQLQFPDTPCVAMMPAAKNTTDVLTWIRGRTGSKITVLTTDANLARSAASRLGGGVEVHLIDPEAPPDSSIRGVTVHASLPAFMISRSPKPPPAK
ncbi:MAG: hypothetical protein JW849_06280 [Phycisphaerae bacterium]|nr:hypothetical protein [Phycisphaerae bacterium]